MNDCTKIAYPNEFTARRAALAIATNLLKRGVKRFPRGVHPCSECHAWHITSHRTNAKLRVSVD